MGKSILSVENVRPELDELFSSLYSLYSDLYADYQELYKVLNNIDLNKSNDIYSRVDHKQALFALCQEYIPGYITEEYELIMEDREITALLPEYLKERISFSEYDIDHIDEYNYIQSFINQRLYPIQKDIILSRMVSAASYVYKLTDTRINIYKQVQKKIKNNPNYEKSGVYIEVLPSDIINNTKWSQNDAYILCQASYVKELYKETDKKETKINNKIITDLMFTNHALETRMLDALTGRPYEIRIRYTDINSDKIKKSIFECIQGIERYKNLHNQYKNGKQKNSPIILNDGYVLRMLSTYLKSLYAFSTDETLKDMGVFLNKISSTDKQLYKFGDGTVIKPDTVNKYYNEQVDEVQKVRNRAKNGDI